MSRRKMTARDKKTQKMSRNGVVERNAVTGDEQNISNREANFDLRNDIPERETLSQVGTRLDGRTETVNAKLNANKKAAQRQNEHLRETNSVPQNEPPQVLQHENTLLAEKIDKEQQPVPDAPKNQAAVDSTKSYKSREPPNPPDDKGSYISQHQSEISTADLFEDIDKSGSVKILEDKPKWDSEQLVESLKHKTRAAKSKPGLQHDVSPHNQSSGKNKLKIRNNTAYQEQQLASLQHKEDSDVSLLKHQNDKLTFSETKPEQPAAPIQKSGKLKKLKNKKYNTNQSSAIKHEPPIINLRGDRPNSDTLSQVGTMSGEKENTHPNTAFRQDKFSAIQHEQQNTDSRLTHNHEPSLSSTADTKSNKNGKFKVQRSAVLRNLQPEQKMETSQNQSDIPKSEVLFNNKNEISAVTTQTEIEQINNTSDIRQNQTAVPVENQRSPLKQKNRKDKFRIQGTSAYRQKKLVALEHEPLKPDSQLNHTHEKVAKTETGQTSDIKNETAADQKKPKPPDLTDNSVEKNTETQQNAPISEEAHNGENFDNDTETENPSTDTEPLNMPPKPDSSLKHDKSEKLKFKDEEVTPEKPDIKQNRKLVKTEKQVKKAGQKLEKAKDKLPVKRKLRSERVFDEQKGKAKHKLYFEKEVKTQSQHLKGALPLRPVKAGANTLLLKAHSKIYQVEHENVAVKAAHRVEMIGETGVRSALRHHKTAPYRKVAKLEKQVTKKTIRLNYQKALAENPKLKSNVLSRMWQKRKIKKDYAKAAQNAKKTAQRAKKAGSTMINTVKAIAQTVYKNPKVIAVILLAFLLIIIIMSLFTMCSNIGSGGIDAYVSSSYLAEDENINNAEIAYTEWETDLRLQIAKTETDQSGYDEYRYNIGNIGHNPYDLMAYLTAMYFDFSYDAISNDLQALFNEQYSLSFTPSVEIRYTEDEPPAPYDWNVLTVTLTARPFNEVVFNKMNTEQLEHYGILTMSGGNRQYVESPFDFNWRPYITSNYGYRVHPITEVKDLHLGIDIGLPEGTEIHSAQAGKVTFAGASGDYGNVVVIEDADGLMTKYAHCATLLVSVNQTVSAGDVIATVGSTGTSTGAHLHFEVLKNGEYLNPAYFSNSG